MKRMWQKYTPGKRILALLLAGLMLCDTFTASAATNEGTISQEVEVESEIVEVTEEVADTEKLVETTEEVVDTENLVEENEGTVETEVVEDTEEVIVENTEQSTEEVTGQTTEEISVEIEEKLSAEVTEENFKVYVAGMEVSTEEVSRIYTHAGEVEVTIEQVDVDFSASTIEVSILNRDGTIAELERIETSDSYYTHVFYYYGSEFNGKTVTVTIDGTAYEYEIEADQLKDSSDSYVKGLITYGNYYSLGDELILSTTFYESGVFGYVTEDSEVLEIQATDMPEAAVSEWTNNYQSTYGEYGADGKYYCFTYSDTIWYPSVTCVANGRGDICYYYIKNGEEEYAGSGSVFVSDYSFVYEGSELKDGRVNIVSYKNGDLIFELYDGAQKVVGGDLDVSISNASSMLDGAIEIVNDENGCYVRINASQVKDYDGNVVGLAQITNGLYFDIKIETEDGRVYLDYSLAPSGVIIDSDVIVEEGETFELQLGELYSEIMLPALWRYPEKVSDIAVVSSDTSVLGLHGEISKVDHGDSWSYNYCFMEPKKVGTSDVTVSYKYDGTLQNITFKVQVVAESDELNIGYYNDKDEFIELKDGSTLDVELDGCIRFYTNVSPRVLSDIKLTSSNTKLLHIDGTIGQECTWDSGVPSVVWHYACGLANNYTTGTVTLAFSAVYNGEKVTRNVTINIVEPHGIQVRDASSRMDTEGNLSFEVYSGRTTTIGQSLSEIVGYKALYDDDAEGNNSPANKDDYIIEVLKRDASGAYVVSDDYTVYFVNDYIFYVLPDVDALSPYDYEHILRITSKTDTGNTTDVSLQYSDGASLYLTLNEETKTLSKPINSITLIEGEEFVAYFPADEEYSVNYRLYDWFTQNGVSLQTEVVYEGEWENIIKATFSYDGTSQVVTLGQTGIINADNNIWVTSVSIDILNEIEKEVVVPTQRELSDFLNTADSSKDLKNVRMGYYEVSFITQDDGSKAVILLGYFGEESSVCLPSGFRVEAIFDTGSQKEHAISRQKLINVIGCEDGMFDIEKGCTQPEDVILYSEYTYFGINKTGFINKELGKRTRYDFWSYSQKENNNFYINNGMLLVPTESGCQCVDTGNAPVNAVAEDVVRLNMNQTTPSGVLRLKTSNYVSSYVLSSAYLLDANDETTAFAVSQNGEEYTITCAADAAVENGTYYLVLTPTVWGKNAQASLENVKVKVDVELVTTVPEVRIENSEIIVNTYLGDDALTILDIYNSLGTSVTAITLDEANAEIARNAGLLFTMNGDRVWLLYWDGKTDIPDNTKLEVGFVVEGVNEGVEIAKQTLTISGKELVPQTTLADKKLTFDKYPFTQKLTSLTVKNGHCSNMINPEATLAEVTSVPKGGSKDDIQVTFQTNGTMWVDVSNNAVSGTYQVKITPVLRADRGTHYATPATLSVVVKSAKPTMKFAEKVNVTLNSYFYNTQAFLPELKYANTTSEEVSRGVIKDSASDLGVVTTLKSMPKGADDTMVSLTALYAGGGAAQAADGIYGLQQISLAAGVTSAAVKGNYAFEIRVPVMVDDDVVWMSTTATIKVVNTLPNFKFSSTTVTLDAAYPYNGDERIDFSNAEIRLLMEEGYTLAGARYEWGTNWNLYNCLQVSYSETGSIYFELAAPGFTKGGSIRLIPRVIAPNGEEITLKPIKVNVKVTNSSSVTLSSKVNSITVNPYLGGTAVNAGFTRKGFKEEVGLTYTYDYIFVPTNEDAYYAMKNNEYNLAVVDGQIVASDCQNAYDGKYTYNVIEKITASDGTIVYSKPAAFTVTIAKKGLTVVPEKKDVTVYKDLCHVLEENGKPKTYMVFIPVSIKEVPDAELYNYVYRVAENNLSKKDVITKFVYTEEEGTLLSVQFPASMGGVKKLQVTPLASDDYYVDFAPFTVNISMKEYVQKVSFAKSNVTIDRYVDSQAVNYISHTEGFDIYSLDDITVKKKGTSTDIAYMFNTVADEEFPNHLTISVKEAYKDEIANGTYIVTVRPRVGCVIQDETGSYAYGGYLGTASFNLNITQPKVKLSISEKSVNLYPDLGEFTSDQIVVKAFDGDTELAISRIEAVPVQGKAAISAAIAGNMLIFTAAENASGSNVYDINVYANYLDGTEVLAGTLSNAVTVNAKSLPDKISLTNAKLTFSPYLEQSVSTSIKDAEMQALLADGTYSCVFTYEGEKESLDVSCSPNGVITITDKQLPETNTTYKYTANIEIQKAGVKVKDYAVNFQVAVKNTKPTAAFKQSAIALNNAYMNQGGFTGITLKTGNGMWKLTGHDGWKVVVKNSKNKDITELNYFDIDLGKDGAAYTGEYAVWLNNVDAAGKTFSVPNGKYKIMITPQATDGEKTIELTAVTLNVTVTSNRPTVKYKTTSLTVNTYDNMPQQTKLTLSGGGSFCTQEVANENGIHVMLASDGTLTAWAERNAKAGKYKFAVAPTTIIDDWEIALDTKNITVTVKDAKPTAAISNSGKAALNTLFANTYETTLTLGLKGMDTGSFEVSTDSEIVAVKNDENSKKLLEQMSIVNNGDGTISIVVHMKDAAVPKGNYSFKVTPKVRTGSSPEVYELKPVTFKVTVENKKPTLSAKAQGTLDLVNRSQPVAIQLAFSKQNYEVLDNITDVVIMDGKYDFEASELNVDESRSNYAAGQIYVRTYNGYEFAANKSYSYRLLVTTSTGQEYVAKFTIKTTQSNYKVTAQEAVLYTEVNSGEVMLDVTNNVSLQGVALTKVTKGRAVVNAKLFDCRLGYTNGEQYIEIWANGDVSQYKGQTLTFTFVVTPYGLATNKKPTTITVPVTIK